jgi:N-acetylglucosaminyldiphosphoundecaprenol N-acetyl-beta-D-mannosaminyltransferase
MAVMAYGRGLVSESVVRHLDKTPEVAVDRNAEVVLGGVRVDLVTESQILSEIEARLRLTSWGAGNGKPPSRILPLAIASANIDHIHHFGVGGRHAGSIDQIGRSVIWRVLLDGSPLARRSRWLTKRPWPRLSGSDLLEPILDRAVRANASVGFLGGTLQMQDRLLANLKTRYPDLLIAGTWAPTRTQLGDRVGNMTLAADIRASRCDVLVVGLGKPRQEHWIESFGADTDAGVLLAFGASADFIAGAVNRAPAWMRVAGLEWVYRLAREPRRLARRYLIEGPVAVYRLFRNSH